MYYKADLRRAGEGAAIQLSRRRQRTRSTCEEDWQWRWSSGTVKPSRVHLGENLFSSEDLTLSLSATLPPQGQTSSSALVDQHKHSPCSVVLFLRIKNMKLFGLLAGRFSLSRRPFSLYNGGPACLWRVCYSRCREEHKFCTGGRELRVSLLSDTAQKQATV